MAITVNGAALIAQGRYEEGIAGMRQGISAFRATGARPHAWFLCYLANGLGRIGRPQEGLQVLEEGFASVAKTGEQLISPSLHHVKGELLLAQNPSDVAEAEHVSARRSKSPGGKVRDQGVACHDEPRAAARKQGRRDEARAMLAEIYDWFTEGFDTADLKDAKALLDELNE